MPEVRKSISIGVPVGKVFKFVTSPENWTRYVTSLTAVKDLSEDSPSKGSTFNWEYRMMGIKFSGKGEVIENVKNKRFGLTLKGRANIKESYEFIPDDKGGTTLNAHIDYDMPGPIAKVFANSKLVEKLNNLESKNILEKIKAMAEAGM